MGGTASKQEFRTAVLDLVNSKQVEIKMFLYGCMHIN